MASEMRRSRCRIGKPRLRPQCESPVCLLLVSSVPTGCSLGSLPARGAAHPPQPGLGPRDKGRAVAAHGGGAGAGSDVKYTLRFDKGLRTHAGLSPRGTVIDMVRVGVKRKMSVTWVVHS